MRIKYHCHSWLFDLCLDSAKGPLDQPITIIVDSRTTLPRSSSVPTYLPVNTRTSTIAKSNGINMLFYASQLPSPTPSRLELFVRAFRLDPSRPVR